MADRAAERGGYTTNVFVLDCGVSMGELVPDPELDRDEESLQHDGPMHVLDADGKKPPLLKTKLQWAKEYVMRRISALIFTGRKTEHCMVIATGDRTNNAYEGYEGIDVVFPPYTAAQWMIKKVQAINVGREPGDVLAGLSIALSALQGTDATTKPRWTTDFHLVTDGESELLDADVQINSLLDPGLKFFNHKTLLVVGYGFADKKWEKMGGIIPDPQNPRIKHENERTFKEFVKRVRKEAEADAGLLSLSRALSNGRAPQLRSVKPTAKSSVLRLAVDHFGESDPEKALTIHVKIAKMTDASSALKKPKAKPVYVSPATNAAEVESSATASQRAGATSKQHQQELKEALLRSGVEVQKGLEGQQLVQELEKLGGEGLKAFNQEQASLVEQLRNVISALNGDHIAAGVNTRLWNILAADLQPQYTFAAVHESAQVDKDLGMEDETEGAGVGMQQSLASVPRDVPAVAQQPLEPEAITRGHKFGSSWIPVEIDPETDKPVRMGNFQTEMGIDICKFVPASSFPRELEMSELRYIWADEKSSRAQIELSSLVHAMVDHPNGEMMAVMRFVYINNSAPYMVIGKGIKDGARDHIECVRVPFQDDFRKNFFPSLEFPKNEDGDLVTEHSTLPTKDQQIAMNELIEKSIVNDLGEDGGPWFNPELSYNPSIHVLKAFQQHQQLADPADPPPAMHPALTRYFKPPKELAKRTKSMGKRVAEVFDLRPVPPKKLKRKDQDDNATADEAIDLQEMFGVTSFPALADSPAASPTHVPESSDKKPDAKQLAKKADPDDGQSETQSDTDVEHDDGDGPDLIKRADKALAAFKEAWKSTGGAGDTVSAAIEALGNEVKTLVQQGSKDQALKCIRIMREECLNGEESPAFNDFMSSLKTTASEKAANAFWPFLRVRGGRKAGLITFQEDKEFQQSKVTPVEADEFLRDP